MGIFFVMLYSTGSPQFIMTDPSSSHGQTRPQREILLAAYRPLKYLRPEQKKLLKTVWSLDQGLDGTRLACVFCKVVMDFPQITVHHKDGEETNNELPNLTPACWEDNRKEGQMIRARRKAAQASKQERENLSSGIGEESEKELPPEIAINVEGEPAFREFVVEHIIKYGMSPSEKAQRFLRPADVLNAGSNWAGPNPKTCYPYLSRMTNPINGFIAIKRNPVTKKRYLTFRHDFYFDLTPEEILKMNPKEGLKARTDEVLKANRQPAEQSSVVAREGQA